MLNKKSKRTLSGENLDAAYHVYLKGLIGVDGQQLETVGTLDV